jgi:hypothetical protein
MGKYSWQLATGSRQQKGMLEFWNTGKMGTSNIRGELFLV